LSGFDLNMFDAQFAVNQFSGNQSLLVQILEKFVQQYQHFDTLLAEHLQQNDLNAVKQQVHTLKGVSGNLGMKVLHQACKDLEENLENQVTEHTVEEFLQTFKQTLALVKIYSKEESTSKSPDTASIQDEKAELIAALKRSEFISDNKMQSYAKALNLSSDKLNELEQAIDDLDYTRAIELLD
jgi:HPt (histidine-containing phosphotransfer) domain-containing protein